MSVQTNKPAHAKTHKDRITLSLEAHIKQLELDSRKEPSTLDKSELLTLLDEAETWVARMLLLRLLSRVEWQGTEAETVKRFAQNQFEGDNKLVKAWALDTLA